MKIWLFILLGYITVIAGYAVEFSLKSTGLYLFMSLSMLSFLIAAGLLIKEYFYK